MNARPLPTPARSARVAPTAIRIVCGSLVAACAAVASACSGRPAGAAQTDGAPDGTPTNRTPAHTLGGTATGDAPRGASASDATPVRVRVQEVTDDGTFTAAHPEQFPVVAAGTQEIADRLSVTGVVTPDPNRAVPVNALGGGRVVAVRARLGDVVRRGQTLVVIASPDAAAAQSDYQKAVADEALARKQQERAHLLYEHGAVALKDVETADDAEQKARVDVRTAAERVRLLGASLGRPTPYIELTAPIGGTIVQQNTAPSAGVKSPDNAPNLFTIADLSHVWVLCDVYESDAARVRPGARAEVHLNALPGRTFTGTVGNVSPVLDSATRTMKLRVELPNPGGVMRQGMFATADIVSPRAAPRVVVPATALIRLHDADWVFVQDGATHFRRVQVQAGPAASDGTQQVLAGLTPGTPVVRNALDFSRAMSLE